MNRQEREVFDAWHDASRLASSVGVRGFGVVHLMDGDGRTLQLDTFTNILTTAGDEYYARKIIVGIGPTPASAPTAMNGMKLGTSSTAAAKSGTNSAIVGTYISGSNVAFDATGGPYPTVASNGSDTGWNINYKTTWAAGTATNSTINEVVLVNDQASNATTSQANTHARAVITTVNKTATDILAITWTHRILGA